MKKVILLLSTIVVIGLNAQQKYPIAPEIWSEPVILDTVFARAWQEAASFTTSIDTAYYEGGTGIYMSFKKNGKWTSRVKLNSNINDQGVAYRNPTICKNGRRLFFSAWKGYGGWDIWYSDWEDKIKDWGQAYNMGNVINNQYNQDVLYEVSKDTVFCLSQSETNLYAWKNDKNSWAKVDSFWYHDLGIGDIYGIAMPASKKKIYYGRSNCSHPPKYWCDWDILVTYWDQKINYWGEPYSLNINTAPKYTADSTRVYGGAEVCPWVSPNGKILILTRTIYKDSTNYFPKIFISYLLVDEKGVPVSIKNETNRQQEEVGLSNYPNPFNATTQITYRVLTTEKVVIKLFDSLGKQIDLLVDEVKQAGSHSISMNFSKYKLSSGVYFCTLITKNALITNKLLYLK